MAKELSMEEKLKLRANSTQSSQFTNRVQKETPAIEEQPVPASKVEPSEPEPIAAIQPKRERKRFNLDDREKGVNKPKKETQFTNQTSQTQKNDSQSVNTNQQNNKSNNGTIKEPITADRVVEFVRDGNGRYVIGGIIAFLLVAYVFGVLLSMVTVSRKPTVNPFKAIFYAFTTTKFLPVLALLVIVGSIIGVLIILFSKGRPGDTDREFGHSDALGSGSFATEEEKDSLTEQKANFKDMTGFVFGMDPKTRKYVGLPADAEVNRNFAVCGSQGTMKSWGYVRNNITQLVKMGQSIIITDPKGEMYRDMSRYLIDSGYVVKQWNQKDLYSSDSWNCLKDVNENNIDSFASTFITNLSDAREQEVFKNLKIALFKALCLYTIYEDKDLEDNQRTLGQAYKLLEESTEQDLDDRFLALANSSKAKQSYLMFMKGEKLKQNTMSTLATSLQFFQRQAVKEVTGTTDIDLLLPGKEKCAYFVILNDQDPVYSALSSIFIKMMIEGLVDHAYNQDSGKTDLPVHFMLDEFPTIGKIPGFEVGLGTWRGYGIGITIIFQNIPQLRNRYPDDVWLEILGACDMQILLGANEEDTADYYSKKAGKGTIVVESERRQLNRLSPLDTKSLTQVAKTEAYQQMDVITSDEVMRLREDKTLLLFIGGSRPFKLEKVGFDHNPAYPVEQYHAKNNIPLWMNKLKEHTNFKTEYGGVYTLGKLDELPAHVLERIDRWRTEYFNGTGQFISNETLPITLSEIHRAEALIRKLNMEQAEKLIIYLEKLVNTSAKEFISNVREDVDQSITNEVVPEEPVEAEVVEVEEEKPVEPSSEPKKPEVPRFENVIQGQPSGTVLSTNGRPFTPKPQEPEEKSQDTPKKEEKAGPITFNVSFNVKER
jgi:type IV secretion system protein VirD4